MINVMIIHELKACRRDLEHYYDYQKKSNIVTTAIKKRRLEAIEQAIIILGGELDQPAIQEELHF
jgi:hypothetical protein